MTELWDLYDANRHKTNRTIERGKQIPKGFYHLSVSIWLIDSKGQFLLSQRHPQKTYPLFWECTGGSVLAGENSLSGAVREVREELGISLKKEAGRIVYQTRRELTQDFYDVWLFETDVSIDSLVLQPTEVVDAQWISKEKLLSMYKTNQLHPLIDYIPVLLHEVSFEYNNTSL